MNTIKIVFFSIFGGFLIFFVIYSWIVFYHIRRFGYQEGVGRKVMLIYLSVVTLIIGVTLILASSVGWETKPSSTEKKFNLPLFEKIFR